MMTFKRTSIFPWLIAALSLVPVSLYAYLGQFTRLIGDDYCNIARVRERDAWDFMIFKLNTWSGSYANWFLKGAMAPLDTLAPRIMPAIIIVLWLVSLSWLVFQCLACLKIDKPRRALSVTIAALIVTASIHAFYSLQSLYWYTASTPYTLPLPFLTMYLALSLWTARRSGRSLLALIAGGLLCFISGGASEMFLVFQLTVLTFCLLAGFAFLRSSERRSYLPVFGVGWLTTLGSLAIQLSSPGVAIRAAFHADETMYRSLSARSTLASGAWDWVVNYIDRPQVVLGFVMLLSVGLLVMLVKYKPPLASEASKPIKLALPPLWFGLIFQLLWLPRLWGRESGGYLAVILNFAFILGFLVLLWQRKRIDAHLRKHDRGLLIVYGTMALVFVCAALFAITRQSLLYRMTSSWLYMSVLVFGGIIIWQLSSLLSAVSARRLGLLVLLSYAIAAVCGAVMAALGLYGRGFAPVRILSPVAYALALPGLICGAYIGCALKHYGTSSRLGLVWIRFLKLASAVIVLTVGMGIVLGQAALIPDFQLYAREWEARHQKIIAERDSGQKIIEVMPFTYDLSAYLGLHAGQYVCKSYYGIKGLHYCDAIFLKQAVCRAF